MERQWQLKFYHAVFLDIEMPKSTGIELAERLKKENDDTCVVFLSGHEEMAFEAMKVRPFRFIRKRYARRELPEAVDAVIERFEENKKSLEFFSEGMSFVIPLSRILYIENFNKCQKIVTASGNYSIHSTMEELEQRLAKEGFLRIHTSYLMNGEHILSIRDGKVFLENGESFAISRYRVQAVKQKFLEMVMKT
ncbi:MAG: LytTR family DNA-binding domain-containing protein [Lachnospiraceae bacterium]|nr:LytTR family DNA-binding domain-containing protein [Robinsoniella sp.]MDY3766950.1 LytTR family DNA-binding domain-containing protein [Lachnospiraceae bacterium]